MKVSPIFTHHAINPLFGFMARACRHALCSWRWLSGLLLHGITVLATASIATAFLLFYSEASAAKKAGLQVVILKREGNAPLSEAAERQFVTIRDFSEFLTVWLACSLLIISCFEYHLLWPHLHLWLCGFLSIRFLLAKRSESGVAFSIDIEDGKARD